MWLIDPETREPLPAYTTVRAEDIEHPFRLIMERDPDTNLPVRMRWEPCRCEACEAEWQYLLEHQDELRARLGAKSNPR